jgi:hypothetical protein
MTKKNQKEKKRQREREKERERQKLSCLTEFPYNKYVRVFFPKTAYELLIILPLTLYTVRKVSPRARTDAIISTHEAYFQHCCILTRNRWVNSRVNEDFCKIHGDKYVF